ncbi:DUF7694 domain-containing protein [Kingella oralis]|uniref:DUF7694 domain-containing protein n=1 Tax=Kingella oralis TaxID=505 RepID=UPI0034E4EA9D
MNFNKIPKELYPITTTPNPDEVFVNPDFLVQVFHLNPSTRITVNRTHKNQDGRWADGITWDELMDIKTAIGYGDSCAIEIYPPVKHLVNVSNMRHLWITEEPVFMWKKEQEKP